MLLRGYYLACLSQGVSPCLFMADDRHLRDLIED